MINYIYFTLVFLQKRKLSKNNNSTLIASAKLYSCSILKSLLYTIVWSWGRIVIYSWRQSKVDIIDSGLVPSSIVIPTYILLYSIVHYKLSGNKRKRKLRCVNCVFFTYLSIVLSISFASSINPVSRRTLTSVDQDTGHLPSPFSHLFKITMLIFSTSFPAMFSIALILLP